MAHLHPDRARYLYGIGGRRFPSKQLARTILNAIRVEIAKGTTPADAIEPYLPARRPEHRLVTKAQAWLALQERRCAAGDLSPTYIRELRRHLDPEGWFSWWGNAPAKGVIKGHAEDWSLWLADQGLGPNTRRKCLQTLRSVLLWLEDREEIHRAPRMPRIEVPEYRPRVIEPEEQARIVAAVPEAPRGIYLALCHGIRPGEARALNVEDYDAKQRVLRVRFAMKGRGESAREARRRSGPRARWRSTPSSPSGSRSMPIATGSGAPSSATPRPGRSTSGGATTRYAGRGDGPVRRRSCLA